MARRYRSCPRSEGFIKVSETLQSVSHPDVFAAGDIAAIEGHAPPKSGVYAVRAGPPLAGNLRRMLREALRPYKPQRDALYLISTGERYAFGARNGFTVRGRMGLEAQGFHRPALHGEVQRAAGDGAARTLPASGDRRSGGHQGDLGDGHALRRMRRQGRATILSRALGAIEPAARDDVVVGLDAPDDAAVVDTGGKRLSVHTVDYFRAIVDDPVPVRQDRCQPRPGRHLCHGSRAADGVGDRHRALRDRSQSRSRPVADDGRRQRNLARGQCALVGGHTSEGAELSLGFAVNGLVDRDTALRKGGLQPGDALILTKPVGTGSLLAAHMRGKAKARWVMAAIAHMTQSNQGAAHILRAHGARAATDVTGFGLLGHLVEMVKASEVDATLWLPRVPLLDGLRDTLAAGIFSSLQPQNVRLRRAIRNLDAVASHPLYPVLFDPQTAGGLLASVPSERAQACVSCLARRLDTHLPLSWGYVEPRSASLGAITVRASEQARSSQTCLHSTAREQISGGNRPMRTNPFYDAWLFLIGSTPDT